MKCEWKVAYRRRKWALTAANVTGRKFGIVLRVYKCPECGRFHLTHLEQRKKRSAA